MRVTVLAGGATAERMVAFASAAQIVTALRSRGHTVHVVDTTKGVLSASDEQRLLGGDVGKEIPDAAALLDGERRMLPQCLAQLDVEPGADVLFLAVHHIQLGPALRQPPALPLQPPGHRGGRSEE